MIFSVKKNLLALIGPIVFLALNTSNALAHIITEPHDHSSLANGFFHPLTGLDHILVMVTVGLWAVQLGGRALWAVPVAFVVAMMGGYLLALSHIDLPFVEPAILASIVVIGLIAAIAVRMPTGFAMSIVAVFAVFHGHAHGAEIGSAYATTYGLGFALATVLLHCVGIIFGLAVGLFFDAKTSKNIIRLGGALTAVAGLYLAFAI